MERSAQAKWIDRIWPDTVPLPNSARPGRVTDWISCSSTNPHSIQCGAPRKNANFGGSRARVPCLDHLLALKLHALKQALPHRTGKDAEDVELLLRRNSIDLRQTRYEQLFLELSKPEKSTKPSFASCEMHEAGPSPNSDLTLPEERGRTSARSPPAFPSRSSVVDARKCDDGFRKGCVAQKSDGKRKRPTSFIFSKPKHTQPGSIAGTILTAIIPGEGKDNLSRALRQPPGSQ